MNPTIKTILFCSNILFIPLLGKADMMGGHDRQRLNLLFMNLLRYHFAAQPLEINKSIFPVQVLSNESQPILNVLSEEGGLLKITGVRNIATGSLKMTRVTEYRLNPDASNQTFILGYVQPEHLVSMNKLLEESDIARYQVTFKWHIDHAAEWVWAPVLDSNPRIIRLREATAHSKTSEATLVWKEGRWQIESANVF